MNEIPKKSRRLQRLTLLTLAILVTAVALFYLEEDWRGKRAWDKCQAELAARGIVLDWDKFIPPPVPDDQNFYTASTNILVRFRRAQTEAQTEAATKLKWLPVARFPDTYPSFDSATTQPLIIAEVNFVPRAQGSNSAPPADFQNPTVRQQVREIIDKTVGRQLQGVIGTQFSEVQFSNLVPANLAFHSETTPSTDELENFFSSGTVTNLGRIHVVRADDSHFQVLSTDVHATAAEDYLKWSNQFVPAFDEIQGALKRPYARLPGDYTEPYLMPIPNFITLRGVSQLLCQRAQCHLLLHQPEAALQELTLVHDLCRILQKPPTGKPEMLLEAMINVALSGFYVSVVADGLRLHEWQEPQLKALQGQLETIDLSPWVAAAFRAGLAGSVRTISSASAKMAFEYVVPGQAPGFLGLFQNRFYLFLKCAPRGWVWQNIVNLSTLESESLACFNDPNGKISPRLVDESDRDIKAVLAYKSPFNILAAFSIPNYNRAIQNTAYNQTLANEAQIVCALERFRLSGGEYPATLDALVPSCIEKLPPDVIDGQPLHYRRTDDGKFLLYSVGWNETDDGGVTARTSGGSDDYAYGDWVWKN